MLRQWWDTSGGEVREITRLGVPVMLAQMASTSMTLVDTIMVGGLGNEQLAAAALGNTMFSPLMITSMGLLAATSPMVSQAYGASDHRAVGHAIRQGFIVAGALALIAIVFLLNAPLLLSVLGQDPTTVARSGAYLNFLCWASPAFLGFCVLRNLVEGVSSPRVVTLVTLIGVAINVVGNWILMYGKLGAPALGLPGCGLATVIAYWAMFLMLSGIVLWTPRFRHFEIFLVRDNLDFSYLKELLRVGWPVATSQGLEVGLFSITALLMGLLGVQQLAAHLIAIQCAAFTFMIALGLATATSVRVGQNVGGRRMEQALTAAWSGIVLAIGCMSVPALVFVFFPHSLTALFLDPRTSVNEPVVALAIQLLLFAAAFQVFDGVQVVAMGGLRGFRDTRQPMWLSLISYWAVGLPTGIILAFPMGWGASGLWAGLVMGLLVAAILLVARLKRRSRQNYWLSR